VTLRERLELQVRYQRLRSPLSLSFWEAGPSAVLEIEPSGIPPDVSPLLLEWSFALELRQLHSHLQRRIPEAELWLTCAERPHHAELRALVAGAVIFRAPCNRLQFPASALEVQLAGDPHLGKLAVAELDKSLIAHDKPATLGGVLAQVQSRLRVQFARDPSLTSVARELGMSARTLQRQLDRQGASFHQLLEEVRCAHAIDYLLGSDEAVERIAAYLGYRDPSNFRRAFRRWTGVSPAAFRAERRVPRLDSRPSSAGHG
jgi:AraC-like DNA-binding protein